MRFTTTPKTFCIIALGAPANGQIVIPKRLPLLSGDTIKLLNPTQDGVSLSWSMDAGTGQLVVNVPASTLESGRYAWAFQVLYNLE